MNNEEICARGTELRGQVVLRGPEAVPTAQNASLFTVSKQKPQLRPDAKQVWHVVPEHVAITCWLAWNSKRSRTHKAQEERKCLLGVACILAVS